MTQGSTSPERSRSFPVRILLALLDFYQKGISPLFPPSCRFEPTCSNYAIEALRIHGAVKGSALAIWRLLRCAPWSRGGYDPVPAGHTPRSE